MSVFSDAWHKVVKEAKEVVSDIFSAFTSAGTQLLRDGGPVLITAATEAVIAAETTPGDSNAKFQAAEAAVLAELKDKGLPIVKNAVRLAIENAVANLKASGFEVPTAAAPVAPATAEPVAAAA
jgi:hypothetical protein